jgi:hypothetical protein
MLRGTTILEFDEVLRHELRAVAPGAAVIDCTDLPGCRYACDPDSMIVLRERLDSSPDPGVVLLGSGDFHYVTRLLMERVGEPFTLVLFDNHSDRLPSGLFSGTLTCDAWLTSAEDQRFLEQVVWVGTDPETLLVLPTAGPWRACYAPYEPLDGYFAEHKRLAVPRGLEILDPLQPLALPLEPDPDEPRLPNLKAIELAMRNVVASISTEAVYVSVDKDVLRPEDAVTGWTQGRMMLDELLCALRVLMAEKVVVGMDITGEAVVRPLDLLQPRVVSGLARNRQANLRLLDVALRGGESLLR